MSEFVRHRDRHVKASVAAVLQKLFDDYGWSAPNGVSGQGGVDLVQDPLDESKLTPVNATAKNTVFLDMGDHVSLQDVQLGSGVLKQKYPVFVDVLARNSTAAGMIAEDVRDRLQGLFGGSRFLPMRNQSTGALLDGYVCEVVEVFKEIPDPKKSYWCSLKVGLVLLFPGDES